MSNFDFSCFQNFSDIDTNAKNGSEEAFEVGERYNARIIAVVPATKPASQYCPTDKHGMCLVLAIDCDGEYVVKASPFYGLEGKIFFAKASFAQLMQGLLGTDAADVELQKAVIAKGWANPFDLVGAPCTVEMTSRTGNNGKVFWNVKVVRGTTKKLQGLACEDDTDFHVGKYTFSKFLTVYPSQARKLEGVNFDEALYELPNDEDEVIF